MSSASSMNGPEIIQAITPLVDAFERFDIPYYIGGSVAKYNQATFLALEPMTDKMFCGH